MCEDVHKLYRYTYDASVPRALVSFQHVEACGCLNDVTVRDVADRSWVTFFCPNGRKQVELDAGCLSHFVNCKSGFGVKGKRFKA